jgi:hypothetical protein
MPLRVVKKDRENVPEKKQKETALLNINFYVVRATM